MTVWKRNDTDFEENDEARENDYKNRQSVVMKGPTKDHANQKQKSGYRKVTSMLGSMKKYMVKKVYGESSQAQTNTNQSTDVSTKEAESSVPTKS